jgi:hypothetical protein
MNYQVNVNNYLNSYKKNLNAKDQIPVNFYKLPV